MSVPANVSQLPPLDGTLGSILVGLVLGTFLFGMLTVQVFNYYQIFSKDSLTLKSLVAIIWFLELGHTIAGWHWGYTMIVTFYGQPEHIANPPGSFELLPLFSGVVHVLVESFFAFRIHALSGRWWLTVVCCILNIVAFVLSIMLVVSFYRVRDFAAWELQTRKLSLAATSVVPANDILITLGLCYNLWRIRRPQNRLTQTRTMITTLIRWTVENTVVTSAASFLQLILLVTRNDLTWIIFFLMHAKLLSNCLVVSLNGRHRFRPRDTENGLILSHSVRIPDRVVIGMTRVTETFSNDGLTGQSKDAGEVVNEDKSSGSNSRLDSTG